MKNFVTAVFVLFPMSIMADELVLKDGKTVVWTTLRDLGDSYEVETPEGVKLEVKKSDVVRFVPKNKAAVARDEVANILTGATFTFDKTKKLIQFDLLKSVDLKKDTSGTWKNAGGALVGSYPGDGAAKLFPNYIPPAEYDLTMTLERSVMGNPTWNGFAVILTGEGQKQLTFLLDIAGHSGAACIDNKGPDANGVGVPDPLFPKVGTKRTVVFMVRKFGFLVKVDGKDFLGWKGSWDRLSPHPVLREDTKKNSLYFITGIGGCEFKIHQAVVTFPKE